MDIAKRLRLILRESENEQYGPEVISTQMSETDKRINEVMHYCDTMSKEERKEARSSITIDIAQLLLCFGARMATYSLRLSEEKCLTYGLSAIDMAFEVLDIRDIWVVLVLYCDVQKRSGFSLDGIFDRGGEFTHELKNFIHRKDEFKTLECMGYSLEVDENDLLIYRRAW
ncbi:MAG: hypothetical protein FWG23_07120 [Eggerthellaceae bacterium]|jgi:hypothetical protein|nr:hypothetical protein [Eggerthellaceae bacterium]